MFVKEPLAGKTRKLTLTLAIAPRLLRAQVRGASHATAVPRSLLRVRRDKNRRHHSDENPHSTSRFSIARRLQTNTLYN